MHTVPLSPSHRYVISLLLLLCALLPIQTACSGEQARRAVELVRELIDQGEIAPASTLRLMVKQGNISNFLGKDFELKAEWERQTGTFIDASVIPQLASHEFIKGNNAVDITIARNREYPDLVRSGLITELTPLLERFGLTLPSDGVSGYLLPRLQAYFEGKVYAVPADGDMALLYLRRDLLEDAGNRRRFQQRFGYPLKVPDTWDEYLRQVAFFHHPDEGFYGALEPRDVLTAWMYWMPRYASQSYPNQYLFDQKMRPLLDSPEGIRATENFLKTVPFSPPEILTPGNDYSYTLPFFLNGKGYATIITLAGAKLFNLESSAVRGKFIVVPMPGTRIDGQLVRRSTFIYGNNLVIPRHSRQPLLAFLYAIWVTDPDVSLQMVGAPAGFADPFRYNHLRDPRLKRVYTAQVLETFRQGLDGVVPAGTGLPGDDEYMASLNHNLWRAARREISASVAMKETARVWNQITERFGRQGQQQVWKQTRVLYPLAGKEVSGADGR